MRIHACISLLNRNVYLYVSFLFDEFNMVGPIVNKCNALWCCPQLTVFYRVVHYLYCAVMFCNSPILLINMNQSINVQCKVPYGARQLEIDVSFQMFHSQSVV